MDPEKNIDDIPKEAGGLPRPRTNALNVSPKPKSRLHFGRVTTEKEAIMRKNRELLRDQAVYLLFRWVARFMVKVSQRSNREDVLENERKQRMSRLLTTYRRNRMAT